MVLVQRLLASAGAAALAAIIAAPACAADAGAQVEEVIVTAQKRAENVQDVPISMEVVSAKKLEAFHTDTFKALTVPNMNTQEVGGNQVIYMRGFGSPSQNYAFDQSVSLYVDGVYAGKSRQFMAPFFDLQRIEVLRGPQGALFGKNTAAGAISIVSAQPSPTFEGAITGIYNFDQEGPEVFGYVSGPIPQVQGLSARLAVKYVDKDGWIRNGANGQKEPTDKTELARLTVKYAPNDSFEYVAKAEYGYDKSKGNATVSGPLDAPQHPLLSRFAIESSKLGPAGFDTLTWNAAGTGNLRLGEFTLTSITGFSFFRAGHVNNFDQTIPSGGLAPASVFNSFPEHFQQWSQEVRLQSPTGGRFDYIVGAYYDNSQYKANSFSDYRLVFGNFLLSSQFEQQAESYSFFGQGTYHVTDALRVLGSLRYSHTNKRGNYFSQQLQGPFQFRPDTKAKGDIDEGRVDPSVTLQYDVAPQIMAYFSYGRGSKSGGFVSNSSGTTDATFVFQPEHSTNYELGVKSTLLNGSLVANAAIYKIEFDNLQVSTYNPNVQAFIVGNAAEASGKGVEGALTWYPVPNLDVTASAAYQDVHYDDFPGAQCLASQPISQCNPLSPASVLANNLAGTPLPNISKFSGTIQGHYVADLPRGLKLGTTVAVSGRSKFFNSDDESPLYGLQPGYAKVDARIELYPDGSRWHVALVGTNLGNELTTAGSFRLPVPITTVSRALYWVDPPRNVSIEAGLRF
jgi:iron complex outermembrane receptor protein